MEVPFFPGLTDQQQGSFCMTWFFFFNSYVKALDFWLENSG
jgi:hypothetical protein